MTTSKLPRPLGTVRPADLDDARLQLHWALQVLAAVGDAAVEHRPDDSHSSCEWLAALRSFVGHAVASPPHCRAALHPADLTLLLVDQTGGRELARLPLPGQTLHAALDWMSAALGRRLESGAAPKLELRDYEMPEHPVGEGAKFVLTSQAAFDEAVSWYEIGDRVLRRLAERRDEASAVLCWPHHFDLATMLVLGPDPDPEKGRSVGVGVLLGDDSYAEPYWYVTHHPRPESTSLPALAAGGHWREEGFFGAILTASALAAAPNLEDQERRIESFIASAFDGLRV